MLLFFFVVLDDWWWQYYMCIWSKHYFSDNVMNSVFI